jgi:hypothetical protein
MLGLAALTLVALCVFVLIGLPIVISLAASVLLFLAFSGGWVLGRFVPYGSFAYLSYLASCSSTATSGNSRPSLPATANCSASSSL